MLNKALILGTNLLHPVQGRFQKLWYHILLWTCEYEAAKLCKSSVIKEWKEYFTEGATRWRTFTCGMKTGSDTCVPYLLVSLFTTLKLPHRNLTSHSIFVLIIQTLVEAPSFQTIRLPAVLTLPTIPTDWVLVSKAFKYVISSIRSCLRWFRSRVPPRKSGVLWLRSNSELFAARQGFKSQGQRQRSRQDKN